MAERQSMPRLGKTFAAGAAIVLLTAWHATPATASSNTPVMCDDVADGSLEIPASELQMNIVSHEIDAKGTEVAESDNEIEALSSAHYLAPRVEAVLRKVFKDTATPLAVSPIADSPITDSPIADSDKRPVMNTRVPGVSDDELARYKRQMYRTDI